LFREREQVPGCRHRLTRQFEGRIWGECWDDQYEERGAKVHASNEPVTGVFIS
jgi:hypothetical protein